MDVFTKDYWQNELKFYGEVNNFSRENLSIKYEDAPILLIDNKIWMALRPKNVQSLYLPIQKAKGAVGTAGLGLGYFALKVASKPEVTSVKVWEINTILIDWFTECFKSREEFNKIQVISGGLSEVKDRTFNYFFNDIYSNPIASLRQVTADMQKLKSANNISESSVWLQELLEYTAFLKGMINIPADNKIFFESAKNHPNAEKLIELIHSANNVKPQELRKFLSIETSRQYRGVSKITATLERWMRWNS